MLETCVFACCPEWRAFAGRDDAMIPAAIGIATSTITTSPGPTRRCMGLLYGASSSATSAATREAVMRQPG